MIDRRRPGSPPVPGRPRGQRGRRPAAVGVGRERPRRDLSRIDPRRRLVTIDVGGARRPRLAFGAGSLWVADVKATAWRRSTRTNTVVQRLDAGNAPGPPIPRTGRCGAGLGVDRAVRRDRARSTLAEPLDPPGSTPVRSPPAPARSGSRATRPGRSRGSTPRLGTSSAPSRSVAGQRRWPGRGCRWSSTHDGTLARIDPRRTPCPGRLPVGRDSSPSPPATAPCGWPAATRAASARGVQGLRGAGHAPDREQPFWRSRSRAAVWTAALAPQSEAIEGNAARALPRRPPFTPSRSMAAPAQARARRRRRIGLTWPTTGSSGYRRVAGHPAAGRSSARSPTDVPAPGRDGLTLPLHAPPGPGCSDGTPVRPRTSAHPSGACWCAKGPNVPPYSRASSGATAARRSRDGATLSGRHRDRRGARTIHDPPIVRADATSCTS